MKTVNFDFKWTLYSSIDLFDLGNQLANAAGEKVRQDPKGELVANGLQSALSTMAEVAERDRANPVTAGIHEKDAVRDGEMLMIRDAIKSHTHDVQNSEARQAAKALLKVYNRHVSDLPAMGLGAETRAIKHFIEEMNGGNNKERCDLTGITPLLSRLGTTQAELEALYVERTRLQPEPGECTLKTAMRTLKNAIRRFLGYVDIMASADEQGTAELQGEISRILADVESIARARRTRLHNGDDEGSDRTIDQAA